MTISLLMSGAWCTWETTSVKQMREALDAKLITQPERDGKNLGQIGLSEACSHLKRCLEELSDRSIDAVGHSLGGRVLGICGHHRTLRSSVLINPMSPGLHIAPGWTKIAQARWSLPLFKAMLQRGTFCVPKSDLALLGEGDLGEVIPESALLLWEAILGLQKNHRAVTLPDHVRGCVILTGHDRVIPRYVLNWYERLGYTIVTESFDLDHMLGGQESERDRLFQIVKACQAGTYVSNRGVA